MGFTQLLTDTFTPQTVTRTNDNVGGYTEGWSNGTAFKGRLSVLSANESMAADKVTVYATHKLYCDASVSLAEADRVTFGSRAFEVRTIQQPSALSTGIGHLEAVLFEIV